MSPTARLAGFTAVLALVFAAAAFAGSRVDVHPGRSEWFAAQRVQPMRRPTAKRWS